MSKPNGVIDHFLADGQFKQDIMLANFGGEEGNVIAANLLPGYKPKRYAGLPASEERAKQAEDMIAEYNRRIEAEVEKRIKLRTPVIEAKVVVDEKDQTVAIYTSDTKTMSFEEMSKVLTDISNIGEVAGMSTCNDGVKSISLKLKDSGIKIRIIKE